jgi:hypothetical protein
MQEVAVEHNANNNVELGGRNTFKFFQFGISNILHKKRRVDGGWHIAMANFYLSATRTIYLSISQINVRVGTCMSISATRTIYLWRPNNK